MHFIESPTMLHIMRFDPLKATQAAAVVLRFHACRISRLRLMKILVIADREALAETLEQITADQVIAMDHGPVLSQIYDMLKGESAYSPMWNHYVKQEGNTQNHHLISDPGVGSLSKYEIEKIQDVCDRFRNNNDYDLAHLTHTFPEWQKNRPPEKSSRRIPLSDILEALGIADQGQTIIKRNREQADLDRILGVGR